MKLETFLEEYEDTMKVGSKKLNIFISPSPKEMKAVSEITPEGKALKFFGTLDKKLIVFSPKIFHYNVKKHLGLDVLGNYPQGVAIFKKGQWVADDTDHKYIELQKKKHDWINKKIKI